MEHDFRNQATRRTEGEEKEHRRHVPNGFVVGGDNRIPLDALGLHRFILVIRLLPRNDLPRQKARDFHEPLYDGMPHYASAFSIAISPISSACVALGVSAA